MPDNPARHLRRGVLTAVSALALSVPVLSVLATAPALAASHSAAGSHQTQGTSGTSGTPSSPQPTSNADHNSGGANGQCPGGPYCSTRDGSPSGNGNGGGKATGKPCAGCVGKADNKNPQGQMPNGSDNNAGYECDRNHGIGRSNPAHTGCTTPTTQPPTPGGGGSDCTTNPTAEGCMTPSPGPTPGPGGGGNQCVPSAANNFCATVLGEKQSTAPSATPMPTTAPNAQVLSESVTQPPAATTTELPFTGADVVPLLSAGIAALAVGVLLVASATRRRRLATPDHHSEA